MIKINFVPENLRKKRKSEILPSFIRTIPEETLWGLVGGLIVLLFIVSAFLQAIVFVKFSQRAKLNRQWQEISPAKENVDRVLNELRALQSKIAAIEEVTTAKRIFWAQKLNDISDGLPRGLWLTKVSLDERVLLIEGSAVSKIRDEVISVGNFVTSLKDKKTFMMNLEDVEMGPVQRRQIKSVEVADFLITVKLR